MKYTFTPEQTGRSAGRTRRRGGAPLRALRHLHRHLSDLCAAGRRARQPARPHRADAGDAGEGRRPDQRTGLSHRPLPLLPELQDGLSLQRQLPAPGGPGAQSISRNITSRPWRDRAAALDHRQGDDAARAGALGSSAGPYRRAGRAAVAGPAGRHGAHGPVAPGRKDPSPRSFPNPQPSRSASPSCRAVCRARWRRRSMPPWAGCWRGAASSWWRWKGPAAAARCPITWAARRIRAPGPRKRSRLMNRASMTAC